MAFKKRAIQGSILIAVAMWTLTQMLTTRERAAIKKKNLENRAWPESSAVITNAKMEVVSGIQINEEVDGDLLKIGDEDVGNVQTGVDDKLDEETDVQVHEEGEGEEEEEVDDKDADEVESRAEVGLEDLGLKLRNYSLPGCRCARLGIDMGDLRRARAEAARRPERFPRWFLRRFAFAGESTCSDFATQRGGRQRVLSFCYFITKGKTVPGTPLYRKYMKHAYRTAGDIKRIYPGWLMRIYHSVTAEDLHGTEELCRIFCDHPHVDLCFVHDLPGIGNLSRFGVVGRLWRYAPMGDPAVEAFHCRDIDSYVLERDAAAVREWLSSGKTYHAIHDHPSNSAPLMGGLWGGWNRDLKLMKHLRETLYNATMMDFKPLDQVLLRKIVFPAIKDDLLNHASYPCQVARIGPSVPMPTQRQGIEFCGLSAFNPYQGILFRERDCPLECRPKEHPDWVKC
ncbi:uncharacterized protein LOC134769981 [Penaeus indicus]|uniref:uncharacterized protein LOC134769981 n=1 Tax=Penaeus indicus TaxID=29960 RepID=UPI00300D5AF7